VLTQGKMRRVAAAVAIAVLGVGCARSSPGEPPPGAASSPGIGRPLDKGIALARADAIDSLDLARTLGSAGSSWVEAVRMHRWADAAKLIDALDEQERRRPGVRYARARAARELGDWARVVTELDRLEPALPLLAREITRERAAAQLEVGPFDAAAKYYAARTDPASLIKSAVAYERAADLERSRQAVERALLAIRREKEPHRSRLEAKARAVRARLAETRGEIALAASDLRWISTVAPVAAEAVDADLRLEKLAPKRALTARERLERASKLADHGDVERTERELGLLQALPGSAISKADVLRTRGWALYASRRDYGQASELLEQAVKLGSRDPARDLFYAARARSRAHDDQRAIRLYAELARRHPNTYWAEQAHFLSARLHYIGGRWNEAASGYDAYLKRYRKQGRSTEPARHERAITWLAGGRHAVAAKELAALASASKREHEAALYRELVGVAQAGGGNDKLASESFRAVIREAPLSFAALAAAARLSALGQSLPAPIEPGPVAPAPSPIVIELPAKVRLLAHLGLDDDAEQELAAREEALEKAHAPRSAEALCQAYSALSGAARRYSVGQRAARWSLLTAAPSSSTRWLWECIYPRPYESIVRDAEREHGLPANLVWAVMRQESGFRPAVVSPANAVGLLQLIPPTARNVASELGIGYDPMLLESPPHNIRMGSYYLKKVLTTFGGNVALGAAAYNAGPAAVSRWLETGEKLPLDLFVARIPYSETRHYVARVLGNVARYAYLEGGADAVPALELEIDKGLRAPVDAY
jgi:soluble lytic murein transglycosylase